MKLIRIRVLCVLAAVALIAGWGLPSSAEECPDFCAQDWVICADCAQSALGQCLQDVDDRVVNGELTPQQAEAEYQECWRYYYDEMDFCDDAYDDCCEFMGPEPPIN